MKLWVEDLETPLGLGVVSDGALVTEDETPFLVIDACGESTFFAGLVLIRRRMLANMLAPGLIKGAHAIYIYPGPVHVSEGAPGIAVSAKHDTSEPCICSKLNIPDSMIRLRPLEGRSDRFHGGFTVGADRNRPSGHICSARSCCACALIDALSEVGLRQQTATIPPAVL